MKTENSKPKTLIITAWVFLLLASDLPRIVLQEIFDYPVSIVLGNSGLTFPNDLGFGISAVFVILGLGLTFAWNAVRSLRPFFILGLEISIGDISNITIGKPVDAANNRDIRLLASPTSFLDPAVLKPLNIASGTITITTLQANEISGSASLTFSDPDDVNAVVKDSLAYEVTFSNLAVIYYCPEPMLTDIQFALKMSRKMIP